MAKLFSPTSTPARRVAFAVYGPTYQANDEVAIRAVQRLPSGEPEESRVIEVRLGNASSNVGIVAAEGPECAFWLPMKIDGGFLTRGDWIEVRARGSSASTAGRWIFYGWRMDPVHG